MDNLINHVLSSDENSRNEVFHHSLKMLLKQVRERNVTMNPEATLLIKKYFVASRRARMNEMLKGAEMPLKALQTITIMAEGHAKLSLRHEVSIYDALAAIKLYEENMTLHSGYSLIIQNESPTDNDEVVSSTCIYLHLQNSEVRGV